MKSLLRFLAVLAALSGPTEAATLQVTPGSGATLGQGVDGSGNLLGATVICGATATVALYAVCVNQAIVNAAGQFLTLTTITGTVPLPTGAATAANQEVTSAGTTATSAQAVQGVTGGVAMPTAQGASSVAAGAYVSGSFLSGALADGAITTIGTEADTAWASGNGTAIAILKKIAGNTAGGGGAVTLASGAVAAGAYSVGSILAGADVSEGNITDTAWSGTGNSTVVAALKAAVTGINAGYDATIGATRTLPAVNVPPTSCSGTATGTASNVANLGTATLHGFTIQNLSTTVNLTFSLVTTVVAGTTDFVLLPLGQSPNSYTAPLGLNHAVSVISTASDPYGCTLY